MNTRKFKYLFIVLLTAFAASCRLAVEDVELMPLEPIKATSVSDTINVNIGEKLVYRGLNVESALDLSYEWAYGSVPKDKTINDHVFATKTVISNTSTIDYAFPKVGTYLLRLRLDNGESILYKYFTLNVNAGYDEGVLVLHNDASGNGALSFIKLLTQEEQDKGAQEVYEDIFFAEGKTLKKGVDMYMSDNVVKNIPYAGLLVATADEDGTLYHFEPKTMEVYAVNKLAEYGASVLEFGGEYATASGGFANYIMTDDRRIFRYDMQLGYLQEMVEFEGMGKFLRNIGILTRTNNNKPSTISPFMFSDETICVRISASAGVVSYSIPDYKVVNMSAKRTASDNAVFALFRSVSNPSSYKIMSTRATTSAGKTWKPVSTFTADALKMDSDSKIISTTASNDVYYTFDNAIYRWGLSSAPSSAPAIRLPDGEIIRSIATNFMGKKAVSTGEDLLYVATYNPSRASDKKGSLYVYRFSDNSLVKSYEGLFNEPAKVLYKYRIN